MLKDLHPILKFSLYCTSEVLRDNNKIQEKIIPYLSIDPSALNKLQTKWNKIIAQIIDGKTPAKTEYIRANLNLIDYLSTRDPQYVYKAIDLFSHPNLTFADALSKYLANPSVKETEKEFIRKTIQQLSATRALNRFAFKYIPYLFYYYYVSTQLSLRNRDMAKLFHHMKNILQKCGLSLSPEEAGTLVSESMLWINFLYLLKVDTKLREIATKYFLTHHQELNPRFAILLGRPCSFFHQQIRHT